MSALARDLEPFFGVALILLWAVATSLLSQLACYGLVFLLGGEYGRFGETFWGFLSCALALPVVGSVLFGLGVCIELTGLLSITALWAFGYVAILTLFMFFLFLPWFLFDLEDREKRLLTIVLVVSAAVVSRAIVGALSLSW